MKKMVIVLLILASVSFAQINISGDINSNVTWTPDNDYVLAGQTFVKAGVTLTIEAGTVIKANSDDGNGLAPALVVERGGKIMAVGTADAPITFTANIDESLLPQRGLWGGLILLGKAPTNKGESFVEGLEGVPYGGYDPEDNSGVLQYVRVWYGGAVIGQDNEINGITFAGVGSGTIVDHCEVAYNLDDGFEFFGGTVNIKYMSVLFCGDDAFDTDEGYQGKGQFLFAMLGQDICGRGFEMDNNGSSMDIQPRSLPQFYNVTLIDPGGGTPANDGADEMIRLREGSGGIFKNMLIAHGNGVGVRVKDAATLALIGGDSLTFSTNSIVFNNLTDQFHSDVSSNWSARNVDPQFRNLSDREAGTGLVDPRPSSLSPAFTSFDDVSSEDFFDDAEFIGAFGANLWLDKWSLLYEKNRLPEDVVSVDKDFLTANKFKLLANYPNPFNPTTIIRFEMPNTADVSIQIYAITGSLVKEFELGALNAGYQEFQFNASSLSVEALSSGMFIYKVVSENHISTGKMLLLK